MTTHIHFRRLLKSVANFDAKQEYLSISGPFLSSHVSPDFDTMYIVCM